MAGRKERKRQRRRRGRFGFLYKLLSFLIIFTALLVGCVVFFRVNEVVVMGNSRYTAQEVIDASRVKIGDNLLLVNKPQTARNIVRQLPYVETVSPVRRLPDQLELRISETNAAACVRNSDGWWLINAAGKLVELGEEGRWRDVPQVFGVTPVTPTLGARMAVDITEQAKLEGLRALLTALKEKGMVGGVSGFIDLRSTNVIRFAYGEGLTVVVPMSGDFDRRVLSLRGVLNDFASRGEAVTGTLDLTYGDKQARLLNEQWLPEEWRPVEETPEELPGEDGQAEESTLEGGAE